MEKTLLSRPESASTLNVSLRTLDKLIARGELATRRIGKRRLIPRWAIEQFTKRDHATRAETHARVEA